MRRISAALAFIVLVTGVTSSGFAQGRDRGLIEMSPRDMRSGFYFTGALGAGREQCKFETAPCAVLDASGHALSSHGDIWRTPVTTPSFALRMGGTPNASTRLGIEVLGWSADNGPTTERTVGLLGNVQLYPSRRAGFYVKGGLGYGWSSVDFHDGSKATENGFIFNVGAGYEIKVSRNVSIGPVADFYQASYSSRVGDETLSERILFVGVALTFQSGHRR